MNGALLVDAFAHHCWATLRLLEACESLTAEQLSGEVPGTYGSILDTLRHLVAADRSYLALLSGGAVEPIEEESLDLAGMREVMEVDGPAWGTVLAGELDPAEWLVRRRDDGSESGAPVGIRLAQVVHHGTDHRSQVCTALTNLGIEPPAIDVWDYAWSDGRLTETPAPA